LSTSRLSASRLSASRLLTCGVWVVERGVGGGAVGQRGDLLFRARRPEILRPGCAPAPKRNSAGVTEPVVHEAQADLSMEPSWEPAGTGNPSYLGVTSSEAASRRSSTGGHRNLRWPRRWHGARRRECPDSLSLRCQSHRISNPAHSSGKEFAVTGRPGTASSGASRPLAFIPDRTGACLVRPRGSHLNRDRQLRGRVLGARRRSAGHAPLARSWIWPQ
jgi:hypothetical protein